MIKAPKFWDGPAPDWRARALAPIGFIYGVAAARKLRRAAPRQNAKTFLVGNFVAGGAGKTPTCLALGVILARRAIPYAFLTRGFGGQAGAGPVLAKGQCFARIGDEAGLLAAAAPTYVGADRMNCASWAIAAGAKALILDDGLQSRRLAADFSFAVVDGPSGVGNGLCLPAGPLRAPLDAQWQRTDSVVLVGAGRGEDLADEALRRGKPVFCARLTARAPEKFAGRKIFAVAGLARPEKFFTTLRQIGADVVGAQSFPDHFRYNRTVVDCLFAEAKRQDAMLATTAKDFARWPQDAPKPLVLEIKLEFLDDHAVEAMVLSFFSA